MRIGRWLAAAGAAMATGAAGAGPAVSLRVAETGGGGRVWFHLDIDAAWTHPYDPAEIAADVEVANPDGTAARVPAFYIEPYEHRPPDPPRHQREWMSPSGPPGWRAAYAPRTAGRHRAVARVRASGGQSTSAAVDFDASPGRGMERLRVSRRDPRFFETEDGTPFFAIGQNLCFIGPMQRVTAGRVGSVIKELAAAGVNYLRIWTGCDDWAICFEPGRGGAGPSPEPWPTTDGAVRTRGMGAYNQPDAAMLDMVVDAAEQHGVYLQVCLLTRNAYMKHLADSASAAYADAIRRAQRLFRYAVARWGASAAVAVWEYWNEIDPGLPTGRFYAEMAAYLDEVDPWRRLRAASAWSPAPGHWADPSLSIADLHWYLRPNWNDLWKDAALAVADRAALVRRHASGKPALLSEFGLADEQWRLSPWMRKDAALAHVQDALWASAMSGLSGTAMFWWWETLEDLNAARLYRPLADFVREIPWTDGLAPLETAGAPPEWHLAGLRAGNRAWAWIHDRRASWWDLVAEGREPPTNVEGGLRLLGFSDGRYTATWIDPADGGVVATRSVASREGFLTVSVPPFRRGIALRVAPTHSQIVNMDAGPEARENGF